MPTTQKTKITALTALALSLGLSLGACAPSGGQDASGDPSATTSTTSAATPSPDPTPQWRTVKVKTVENASRIIYVDEDGSDHRAQIVGLAAPGPQKCGFEASHAWAKKWLAEHNDTVKIAEASSDDNIVDYAEIDPAYSREAVATGHAVPLDENQLEISDTTKDTEQARKHRQGLENYLIQAQKTNMGIFKTCTVDRYGNQFGRPTYNQR